MRQVDIQQGISVPVLRIATSGRSGRTPEIGPVLSEVMSYVCLLARSSLSEQPYRLVNPSSWAHDVNLSELLLCPLKHLLQLLPADDVGLLEDGSRGRSRVAVDYFLRFGAKSQVGDENIASILEQQSSKGQVDTCMIRLVWRRIHTVEL